MEADDGHAKSNFTNLAPRPWKSFKDEQAEVMVVQKRSRISLPTRVNLENGNTTKEEGEISKIPQKEEEDKSNGSGAEVKEDEADDAGVYRSLIKEQKNGLNPFDSDDEEGEEVVLGRKVGVRSSKKRRAPQPPPSNVSSGVQEDATKKEDNSEIGKVKTSSNSEEEDGDTVENTKEDIVDIHLEKTMTIKEGEITERRETVLHDGNTVCEEKQVALRTTKKVIDMTIRTSTIEDLDEEDILQELSDEDETGPTEEDTKTDDQIDHEKAKELVLNVETLEHNANKEETQEEKSTTEERFKARSGRISIRYGWSSFMRGISYVPKQIQCKIT